MPTYTFLATLEKRRGQAYRLTVFSQAQNIMAIYHLNIRHCSRNKGQSAQAKFDYINRNDKYSKKLDDLQYSQSGNMPSFAQNNPELFWQSADQFERANARVCTEIEFALPRELTLKQQQELVSSFIEKTINNEQRKLPFSFVIHNDKANNNPHCHLVFSVRQLDGIDRTAEQFFKRANSKNAELGGAKKDRDVIQKEFLQNVRKSWSEQANLALAKYGHSARIDERSYQEQGIDKEPRSRIDRVTWQALRKAEKQAEFIGEAIEIKAKEIATEKAQIELDKLVLDKGYNQEKADELGNEVRKKDSQLDRYEIENKEKNAEIDRLEKGFFGSGLFVKALDQEQANRLREQQKQLVDKFNKLLEERNQTNRLWLNVSKIVDELGRKIEEFMQKFPNLTLKPYEQVKADNEQHWQGVMEQQAENHRKIAISEQFKQANKQAEKEVQEQKKTQNKRISGGFKM